MKLIIPTTETAQSYFEALEKGFIDKSRGITTKETDILAIKNDFAYFIKSFDDKEARGELITLSNGDKVERLPSISRWIWDDGFAGTIGFRWQIGSHELPYYCLGHIGYGVVEWKQNKGLATLALKSICELAKQMELNFVEVVTDIDNIKSQKVVTKNNGILIETFMKPPPLEQTLSNRYRIYLND